jgi:hypothetical protein
VNAGGWQVVGQGGRLTIAVCSDRKIEYGEELTMDYCSYTDDQDEYLSAVCLCGTSQCRWGVVVTGHQHWGVTTTMGRRSDDDGGA